MSKFFQNLLNKLVRKYLAGPINTAIKDGVIKLSPIVTICANKDEANKLSYSFKNHPSNSTIK